MKLLAALLVFATLSAQAEVKVTVGDITDNRSTGKFFKSLEVNLELAGPEIAACKAMRVNIKEAVDDTGKPIPQSSFMGRKEAAFEPPNRGMKGFGEKQADDEVNLALKFENPARAAKTIKSITGTVDLLLPAGDPASVVTASMANDSGKPLANEQLKAAGVELTLSKPKGKEFAYALKDPSGKVAAVEFCSADGKPLETQGRSTSRFNQGPSNVSVSMKDAPPDAVAKIYLITEKSVKTVPIALSSVPLP